MSSESDNKAEMETVRADVKARLATIAKAKTAAADARAHRARLDREHAENAKRLADLIEARDLDDGLRLIDPDSVGPVDPAVAIEIADLSKRVNARRSVTSILDTKAAAFARADDAATFALSEDVLTFAQGSRDRELHAIRAHLAKLAPALARLVAADDVQTGLIGHTPIFVGHENLMSGRVIAESFLNNLPATLRPPGFDAAAINASAAASTAAILTDLAGA